jgi:hypothetical protein
VALLGRHSPVCAVLHLMHHFKFRISVSFSFYFVIASSNYYLILTFTILAVNEILK